MFQIKLHNREIRIGICGDNSHGSPLGLDWIDINKPDINLCNVREFTCGEAVLDYLHHSVIDILFLDCRMNGMDGIQTAIQTRKKCDLLWKRSTIA